jgi:DNA polymerase/3'-5' exonuclease PolX
MNNNIIIEFEHLIAFLKDTEPSGFRLKSIKNTLYIIKKYPHKITLTNLDEFSKLQGIGKGTIDRIVEILEHGHLSELNSFVKEKTDLDKIIGIGQTKISELRKQNITTIKQLKDAIKNNDIKVSPTIKMGLKYHGVYKENIPRKEIDNIYKLLDSVLNNLYIFSICGSYRRGNITSNDIDVLITTKDINDTNHLKKILDLLKSLDNPFIVDSLSSNNKTKYMGFCKYKNNPVRRIDIRFVKYEDYYSALLYFTGPMELNKSMRTIAKKLGYKLSEYGLIKNGNKEIINSEKDIFEILNITYLTPKERNNIK